MSLWVGFALDAPFPRRIWILSRKRMQALGKNVGFSEREDVGF